jgi:hypothetical protein
VNKCTTAQSTTLTISSYTMAKSSPKKPGLYANIHAKQARIKAGSGEKMRKPGSEGAPSAKAFKESAKTAAKPAKKYKNFQRFVHSVKTAKALPKQEYWKGLPPPEHASETFRKIPDIKTWGPFPKYHFDKKGNPVFIYYN